MLVELLLQIGVFMAATDVLLFVRMLPLTVLFLLLILEVLLTKKALLAVDVICNLKLNLGQANLKTASSIPRSARVLKTCLARATVSIAVGDTKKEAYLTYTGSTEKIT